MKKSQKLNKGITLIALVITIIVLLILAGVSIAMLTGENGILTQAETAKAKTEEANAREAVQMETTGSFDNAGKYSKDLAIDNLKNNLSIPADDITDNGDGTLTVKYQGYKFNVDVNGIVTLNSDSNSDSDPDEVTITSADYGKKVNYVAKIDNTLVWRIFYQDEDYVYLISSKADGSNTIENLVDEYNEVTALGSSYSSGADSITDTFLQSLNKQWNDTNPGNTLTNSKITPYFLDQTIWADYKDAEGKAEYAIGGPTIELFMNSFNEAASSNNTTNQIAITVKSGGYSVTPTSSFLSTEYSNGIYCNGSYWFLASPCKDYLSSGSAGSLMTVVNDTSIGPDYIYEKGTLGETQAYGCRPIVVIPKADFDYTIEE